jgi:TonB family protein
VNVRCLTSVAAALLCAACAPVKHVPVKMMPVAIEQPKYYPPTAALAGHEGTVMLLLVVDEKGRVAKVMIDKSSGFPDLDRAATRSAASWVYKPGTIDGVPSSFWVDAMVTFYSDAMAPASPRAMAAHHGTVGLLVSLRADGTVADATVKRSAGESEVDQLAIDAAKRWPFGHQSVKGVAQNSLSRVSMVIDVPLRGAQRCSTSAASDSDPTLRVVGDGLRGNDPDDAQHEIYFTVLTDGCGWWTLAAVWRYDGPNDKPQLVNQTDQSMLSQGPATTVFRVKNPHLWPLGSYHVDVEVDGSIVETKHFVIDRNGLSAAD